MSTSAFHKDDERLPASLHVLRRFIRRAKPEPARAVEEYCEMCALPLATEHRHLLDLTQHTLLCACHACALLFGPRGAKAGKYRLIPRRHLALLDFQIADEQWNELLLPVNMVYLLRSSEAGRVRAFYPGPAGATESLLTPESWKTLLTDNPILDSLEADVEALLINRVGHEHAYYIVPIDACYHLVGLLRLAWRGLSGGNEVWEAIEAFFADLRAKASPTITVNQEREDILLPGQENREGGADERA